MRDEKWSRAKPKNLSGFAQALIAFSLYAGLTCLFFYPAFPRLASAMIGPPGDNMDALWNIWWLKKVIDGHLWSQLTFSKYIGYPEGLSLILRNPSLYNDFLAYPISRFFGGNIVVAYNLLILHHYWIAGLGAFFLIRYFTKNFYASLVGGFVFAFNPSHFIHSNYQIQFSGIHFMPFLVLFYIKLVREKSAINLIPASAFFLLNGLTSWYHCFHAALFLTAGYLYLAIRRKRIFLWDVIRKTLLMILPTVLTIGPWVYQMFVFGATKKSSIPGGQEYFVADLLSWVTPFQEHLILKGPEWERLRHCFTGELVETTSYLGIVALLLAAYALRCEWKENRKFLLGMLTFGVLAMGKTVHIAGHSTGIPLPYALTEFVPGFSYARTPARCNGYVFLFLSVLVGWGLTQVMRRIPGRAGIAAVGALSLMLFIDYFAVSTQMTTYFLPPAYKIVANDPDPHYGILDLPWEYLPCNYYMMLQTMHQKPIVRGCAERQVNDTLANRLESNAFRMKNQLIENKVKYIFFHKVYLPPEMWPRFLRPLELNFEKVFEDKRTVVFQVYR